MLGPRGVPDLNLAYPARSLHTSRLSYNQLNPTLSTLSAPALASFVPCVSSSPASAAGAFTRLCTVHTQATPQYVNPQRHATRPSAQDDHILYRDGMRPATGWLHEPPSRPNFSRASSVSHPVILIDILRSTLLMSVTNTIEPVSLKIKGVRYAH